jgi:hypothetical protein
MGSNRAVALRRQVHFGKDSGTGDEKIGETQMHDSKRGRPEIEIARWTQKGYLRALHKREQLGTWEMLSIGVV